MSEERFLLVGCGILRKEISFVIKKNGWPLDTFFLDSALHVNLEKLSKRLTTVLSSHGERKNIVFFGACHPQMERMLAHAGTFRTAGQNCVEMLLGEQVFAEELEKGAFFLLEDWAQRWDEIVTLALGKNRQVIRDIFSEDRKYLLCLRTACSKDFTDDAQKAACFVDLPLRWRDVSLDRLETILQAALTRKMQGK
jgi:hypothetical protein